MKHVERDRQWLEFYPNCRIFVKQFSCSSEKVRSAMKIYGRVVLSFSSRSAIQTLMSECLVTHNCFDFPAVMETGDEH